MRVPLDVPVDDTALMKVVHAGEHLRRVDEAHWFWQASVLKAHVHE